MAELTLTLNDGTLRKLKAYAMLTGKTVPEIEGVLTGLIDRMLTDECLRELGAYAGERPLFQELAEKSDVAQPEQEEVFHDEVSGHELSGDGADEEVKSLAEQVEEDHAPKAAPKVVRKQAPVDAEEEAFKSAFDYNTKDVGEDADAFLDASLGVAAPKKLGGYGKSGGAKAAAMAFNSAAPRVKIVEHTGDEDGGFFS